MANWRIAAAVLVALAVAIPAAAETIYRDSTYGFEIAQLPGWTVDTSKAEEEAVRAQFNSPDISKTGANCNVTVSATDEAKGLSQKQINQKIKGGWLRDTSTAEAKSMDPHATIMATKVIVVHGLTVQTSETGFSYTSNGTAYRLNLLKLVALVPGWAYNVNCTSLEESYAAERGDFDRIVRSLKILKK